MSAAPAAAPPAGTPASRRRLAWARRRRALAGYARAYAANRGGMAGLAALLLIAAAALAAPLFVSPADLSLTDAAGGRFDPPGAGAPLGTDPYGRSVLDLVVWGARISLTVGFLAAFVSVALGTLVGVIAGHYGGWAGNVLMRVTDWFAVLPALVMAVALAAVMTRSTLTIVIAIGVTAWPATARVVRAQTLAVEARPFIERARALGGGHAHVMLRHVLPNVMPVVLAQTTLLVAEAIMMEATLAFLGLGDPATVSWGGIIQDARTAGAISSGIWWYMVPPGVAIAAVSLAFTMCGRTLESVLNPRLRERQ
ncbi:ABC transporter permease [Streptomonospora nanhaiensis]|uniref:Peptide/nickel transport system permease protein n=1 Tax=Streptomonospora nanhaiensis TaxID=1323731 RepID=A0A853BKF1_9ACTN|nr:ABC transporter permease [Streptomonospora nanhaiensis]MBV2362339.1 ABC transporter permease [Streptomonospora nanhaiensis]MBX9388185.1 ABC transporter permease [Streptomonospora nanhaiensis]NYI95006.1 peptide/nickel transport system permease protein [Streptomonospora nanhaiensis]